MAPFAPSSLRHDLLDLNAICFASPDARVRSSSYSLTLLLSYALTLLHLSPSHTYRNTLHLFRSADIADEIRHMSSILANKTAIITGGSRGIGLAIAKKLAAAGVNVVVAAKTTEPHPKLPGTIYEAAEEIKAAGGNALALVLDLRDEAMIEKVVQDTIAQFGGIDILVNNASAIYLAGIEHTPSKR